MKSYALSSDPTRHMFDTIPVSQVRRSEDLEVRTTFEELLSIPVLHVCRKNERKIYMAQNIVGGTHSLQTSSSQAPSLYTVLRLRLALGLTTLLGAIISYFALSWDIQWHTFVGRDRTLTPPHVLLLSGIVVCGVAALAAVIVETRWFKNNQAMEKRYT